MQVESGGREGSRLLKAVQALAISPQDAMELAQRHRDRFRAANPDARERDVQVAASRSIVSRYANLSATSGGVTALAGVLPGIGTAVAMVGGGLADLTACMKLQVDMVMCLAAVFDWDLTGEDARHLSFLIAASGSLEKVGAGSGAKLASEAGVRMLRQYLRGAALAATKQVFRKVGVTFTRKSLEKAIPFGVGVAFSASANYALTRYVGHAATRWFIHDADLPQDPAPALQAADPAEAARQLE